MQKSENREINGQEITQNITKKRERRNKDAQYIAEKRTIQILNVLKYESDDKHQLNKNQLLDLIKATGRPTTENIGTLSKSLDDIIKAINPYPYKEENKGKYKVKYRGFEKNLVFVGEKVKEYLNQKSKLKSEKEIKQKADELFRFYTDEEKREYTSLKKAPTIKDIYYVHDFSEDELDQLMDAVNFSSHLSGEDKKNLMGKLQGTASKYYSSPFYDAHNENCKFNSKGIYGRFHSRIENDYSFNIVDNIKIIQTAINQGSRIKFNLNAYDETGNFTTEKIRTKDGKYLVSPYYIVVYQDLYYLIARMTGSDNATHYRIDLMTDIEIAKDAEGAPVKIDPLSLMKNLPGKDIWDPQKYMREHMYMFYGEPQTIRILVKKAYGGYTFIHDWFGTDYRIIKNNRIFAPEGDDLLEIEVVCVAKAIQHWAAGYADRVLDYKVIE